MSTFKCKICGGTLEFNPGDTVGECDSCGTRQTLPRLDTDRKINLYDRANHFRRNNEFDKAMGIYEQILTEDNTDAEAYWSLVLCRYGIEYVEDPATHKRVPTVNRAQFTSIFDDDNYKSALQYADISQRTLYEEEAAAINEIQKGILAISQKEEPFDIFICYKETDQNGRRTQDSVLANDLYHQLTQEGFKVFFSRITLEDKLGTAYEPYIFAALNSAKVMVVLGTKPEHFNAVWVKNEWSRYLALVKQSGGKKVLIPAYRDMDPYDLPEEFSHLQAQDMSKLGFMQDLIRGIKKIVQVDESKSAAQETVVVNTGNANAAPLLERAYMFLEDGDWAKADEFCEQVLNIDPRNAQAYLGKLMADLHVRQQEDLPNCEKPFDANNNYQKVIRFGDGKLSETMQGYITHIRERNENARINGIYNRAVNEMNTASTETAYRKAAASFREVPGFKDAESLAQECLEKAEVCRKDAIYAEAKSHMTGEKADAYEAAIGLLQKIPGWKDADEQIEICRKKIEEIKAKEEAERVRKETIKVEFDKLLNPEESEEIIRLKTSISTIRRKIDGIGVFKLKEKKGLQAEINELSIKLREEQNKATEKREDKIKDLMSMIIKGDIVCFGRYEQGNGIAPIEWRVLDKTEYKVLLISKFALDCKPYHENSHATWEECNLRAWLNKDFIETAFTIEEKRKIMISLCPADENPKFDNKSDNMSRIMKRMPFSAGNPTNDKVFLLSIVEARKYLKTFLGDVSDSCEGTAYCFARGASNNTYGCCSWWLRTPGFYTYDAAYVSSDGSINYRGGDVNSSDKAVRPALWVSLEP